MPAGPHLETEFRRRARRLTTPAARHFNPATWRRAYDAVAEPDANDARLLEAALWVGREIQALGEQVPCPFAGLTPTEAVLLGVATLNVEWRGSRRESERAREELSRDEPVGFDFFSNIRYANRYGQQMPAADFLEAGIDAMQSWIYDARRIEAIGDTPDDLAAVAREAMHFYSLRGVLKHLFDKALHQGLQLATPEGERWQPPDPELAALHQAWLARDEANFMTAPADLRGKWREFSPAQRRAHGLVRSAVAVREQDTLWNVVVGRLSYLSRLPNSSSLDREGLRDSHMAQFLDTDMPLVPGLTPARLADAWWVLADIARCVEKSLDLPLQGDFAQIRRVACAVSRRELVRTLKEALQLSEARAAEIVDFLTFREKQGGQAKGDRGLWSAPLVPVPGEDTLLLPQPVFEIGTSLYRLEAWLEKGGIDDTAIEHRGDLFESNYRRSLAKVIDQNDWLDKAAIAEGGFENGTGFPHQTDLLFRLGNRAFVGELKCWLTPADPHEWDRFYRVRLADAVAQAKLRASALENRRDVIAAAFCISAEEAASLELRPIVVLNLGAGFSLEIDGCRIVEADFLRNYLRSPSMVTGGVMRYGRPFAQQVTTLYQTEDEASDRFDAIMNDPWTLRRFLDRQIHEVIDYPRPTGGTFGIETIFRGDLTAIERANHATLMAAALRGGR